MSRHLNKNFIQELGSVSDPRNESYVTYKMEVMLLSRILAYCCHIESMAEMNDEFNHESVIRNISDVCGCKLDNLPHGDTINLLFKRMDAQGIKDLLTSMVKKMIEKRMLERYRVLDGCYQLVIDGTQLYSFHQEHIKKSLTRTHSDGTKTYHTQVVAAYFVIGDQLVVPVDFEMIENEAADARKQDCETKAAARLLARIKKNYPRLKILLSADALYANQTIMKICKKNKWHYVIRFKRGSAASLMEEYEEHKRNGYAEGTEETVVKGKKRKQHKFYAYVNGIDYEGHKVSIAEMKETVERKEFLYITDMEIKESSIKEIIRTGRKRWKIENKGFNDGKNRGYGMSHAYSYHENAVKCHYALMLVSHLLMQILEHYMKTQDNPKKIKELGKEIKEALRLAHLNAQDFVEILKPIQVRQEISY